AHRRVVVDEVEHEGDAGDAPHREQVGKVARLGGEGGGTPLACAAPPHRLDFISHERQTAGGGSSRMSTPSPEHSTKGVGSPSCPCSTRGTTRPIQPSSAVASTNIGCSGSILSVKAARAERTTMRPVPRNCTTRIE